MSPQFETITSHQNPRIKLARKLQDKRSREREGLFLVDDVRDLLRAMDQGYEIEFAFFAEALASEKDLAALPRIAPDRVFAVSADTMAHASYRQNPGGLIAALVQKPTPDLNDAPVNIGFVLGLVDLRKPGNIGALMRTADACGFDAVALIDTPLDRYNPNIIRSSTGACFLPNIYSASSTSAQAAFRSRALTMIAADVIGAEMLYNIDFHQPCALILGTEDQGLPDFWLQASDLRAQIPMQGRITDSLNVSVSGAVVMYEAFRQRQYPG